MNVMRLPLCRRYPWIGAWCAALNYTLEHLMAQLNMAARESQPGQVIYQRAFADMFQHEKNDALKAVHAGKARLVRDEKGEPVRVWYLYTHMTNPDTIREVTRYANNLRKGRRTCG
jgi:hypothetical protein